jgi:hypothetical protein
MADKQKFPQIPSTVWWGVRSILQKSPKATIDERMLGVQLGVQEAAAKQYLSELKNVGILNEDLRATDVAAKWRLNDSYGEAVEELVNRNYPEGLVHLAHPSEGDRQKIISWFEREGLGRGSAGNKAATYLLIGSALPNDPPNKGNGGQVKPKAGAKKVAPSPSVAVRKTTEAKNPVGRKGQGTPREESNLMPLNVNVQIHISADAGVDQINAIFAAMKRYLADETDA